MRTLIQSQETLAIFLGTWGTCWGTRVVGFLSGAVHDSWGRPTHRGDSVSARRENRHHSPCDQLVGMANLNGRFAVSRSQFRSQGSLAESCRLAMGGEPIYGWWPDETRRAGKFHIYSGPAYTRCLTDVFALLDAFIHIFGQPALQEIDHRTSAKASDGHGPDGPPKSFTQKS